MSFDHHSGLTGKDLASALDDALTKWEAGDCDCCAPNPASDMFDELGLFFDEGELSDDSDMTLAGRLHRFGLSLAYATQTRIPAPLSKEQPAATEQDHGKERR